MDQRCFENALALRDSGHSEDAAKKFRAMAMEASDINERASLMINEVRCYCNLGWLNDAECTLKRIRELSPDDPVVCANVDFGAACLAAQKGQFKDALREFEKMLSEHDQLFETSEYRDLYEDIQTRRAIALAKLGRHSEAVSVFGQTKSFITLGVEDWQEVYLYEGICYSELHESDRAKKAYLLAIDCDVESTIRAEARYRVAILYFKEGAFAQAKRQLEMILANHNGDLPNLPQSYVYEQLARTCNYLGQARDAEKYMKMARESQRRS